MNTFRSIDELVKMFEREKVLLKEMFYKRKQLSFRYDYALELTEYKEERIRFLLNTVCCEKAVISWKWKTCT